jgi:hypothetical protein
VAQNELHVSVMGPIGSRPNWKSKAIFGKKACTRKAIARRKKTMCTCREDLTTLGLGFLQCIVMAKELETYKYRYQGIIEGLFQFEVLSSLAIYLRVVVICNILLYELIL